MLRKPPNHEHRAYYITYWPIERFLFRIKNKENVYIIS